MKYSGADFSAAKPAGRMQFSPRQLLRDDPIGLWSFNWKMRRPPIGNTTKIAATGEGREPALPPGRIHLGETRNLFFSGSMNMYVMNFPL